MLFKNSLNYNTYKGIEAMYFVLPVKTLTVIGTELDRSAMSVISFIGKLTLHHVKLNLLNLP